MTHTTRRRLMNRKTVEMLMQGAPTRTIAKGLKVGRARIQRLRGKAKACGYLPPEGRGAGPACRGRLRVMRQASDDPRR